MGNVQSTKSSKTIVNDMINKNTFNSFTKNVNSQNSNCSGNQDMEVIFGPDSVTNNCDIVTGQKLTINCQAQAYFKNQNEQQLKTDLQNSLNNSLDSKQSNENPSFTLVPLSMQNSSDMMNVQNYIKNVVEKNLTTENLSSCLAIAKGAQNQKFNFMGTYNCGPNQKINLTQDMLIQQYAQCGSDIINKAINNDSYLNSLATSATSSQSNLTSGYGAVIFLIVALVVFLIIAYIMFKRSPAGMAQSASSNVSDNKGIYY